MESKRAELVELLAFAGCRIRIDDTELGEGNGGIDEPDDEETDRLRSDDWLELRGERRLGELCRRGEVESGPELRSEAALRSTDTVSGCDIGSAAKVASLASLFVLSRKRVLFSYTEYCITHGARRRRPPPLSTTARPGARVRGAGLRAPRCRASHRTRKPDDRRSKPARPHSCI